MRCGNAVKKKSDRIVSSVNGVGGGATAGAGVAPGMPTSQAVNPAAGSSDSGDFKGNDGSGKIGSSDDGFSNHGLASGGRMSTQSFINLHNQSVQQVGESASGGLDLKKLIEMMIAIQLLQEMSKS